MRHPLLLALLLVGCDSGTVKIGEDPTTTDDTTDTDIGGTNDGDTDGGGGGGSGGGGGGGGGGTDTDGGGGGAPTCAPGDGIIGDLTKVGPHPFAVNKGTVKGPTSCDMDWSRYAPTDVNPENEVIVLSHGFARDPSKVADWARYLASWGFEVYTPALCHTSPFDTDHVKNGQDLVAFSDTLANGHPILYIGHSAGGLASTLAAKADTDAIGAFGLDLVDTSNLAKQAAPGLTIPLWGLRGEPGACNSSGNGKDVILRAPDHKLHKITEASHCDFENPKDSICSIACPDPFNGKFNDGEQQRAMQAMIGGFVLYTTKADLDGLNYWTPGCPEYDALIASGVMQ